MRVLICPQAFVGTLTAVQAAEAIAAGWRTRAPADELTLAPLSAGGPGFLDVLGAALDGLHLGVTVSDPLGREVPAAVLIVQHAGRRTAYIEAAQSIGLHHLAAHDRNPLLTSSFGVGQLIAAAVTEGADRVVVSFGGGATNDGGAGLLAALGVGDQRSLACGAAGLAGLADDALLGVHELAARLRPVELVLATEDDSPLLGARGTSAEHALRKGAAPHDVQALESGLGRFTEVLRRALPPGKDLLSGLDRRIDREPGSGAGGGIGYALMALGARRISATDIVLQGWGFDDLLSGSDLVITGEGCFDWRSLTAGTVYAVASAASRRGLPTVVLAGRVEVGRRETMALGIAGSYAVAEDRTSVAAAIADPVGTLAARAARLAGTWSVR
ncbi:MAG: glycerate kinase [Austwickia sp.]|nr:glycerate kinase [Austwickia sp.]MBK9100820.1 glycerate kinase [Austwickia sp.]